MPTEIASSFDLITFLVTPMTTQSWKSRPMPPSHRRFSLSSLLIAGAVLLYAPLTRAGDSAASEALFQAGKAAQAEGQLDHACQAFVESFRLDPGPGTLLNLGECEKAQGKTASAWQHFRDARDMLASSDDRVSYADRRIHELAPRVPRLTVRVPATLDKETKIYRDDVELRGPAIGLALPTDPGDHVLRVSAPGRKETVVSVNLRPGEQRTVVVEAGPLLYDGAKTERRAANAAHQRTAGVVVAATGGALALFSALGTVAALVSLGDRSDTLHRCTTFPFCSPERIRTLGDKVDNAERSTLTFGAFTLVGLGTVMTGVILYALAPASAKAPASASTKGLGGLTIVPSATGLSGTF